MSEKDTDNINRSNSSRRTFLKTVGTAAAGLFAAPYLKSSAVFAYNHNQADPFLATVAITNTRNTPADSYIYDDINGGIKQKVQYLFEQLGGVSDIFGTGKKVVMKLNMTGGSGNAYNPKLQNVPVTEAM